MRYRVYIETLKSEIDIDYRRKFLSLFKKCLQNYNEDLYNKYYHKNDPIKKSMTFAPYFLNSTIKKNKIIFKQNEIFLNMSFLDNKTGLHFYNSFLNSRGKQICNFFKIKRVILQKEQKFRNQALFKIKSPLIAKEHKANKNDVYYCFEESNFISVLKRNIYNKINDYFEWDIKQDIDELDIKISEGKKIIIKNYGIKFPCTLGLVEMKGENYLIDSIYKSGLSAKSSQGFGYLDIV